MVTQPTWTEEERSLEHSIVWDEPNLRWVKESTIPDENGQFSRWVWDSNTSSYGSEEKFTR